MATLFKNKVVNNIGVVPVDVYETDGSTRATVIGLSLTNLTNDVVQATIRLENTVDNTSAFYIKDVLVPPNQSLRVINGGERLVMAGNMNLYVKSNVADSLDLVASFVEIL